MQDNENADNLITADEAADMLSVAVGTLNVWRCTGRYPLPFVRVGRCVRYRVGDVREFIKLRTVGAVAN